MRVADNTTDIRHEVVITDDLGLPVTGLLAAGFPDTYYTKPGAARVQITLSDLSAITDAHSDGGVYEIGGGRYRLDLPDAVATTDGVTVRLHGEATDLRLHAEPIEVGAAVADLREIDGTVLASATLNLARLVLDNRGNATGAALEVAHDEPNIPAAWFRSDAGVGLLAFGSSVGMQLAGDTSLDIRFGGSAGSGIRFEDFDVFGGPAVSLAFDTGGIDRAVLSDAIALDGSGRVEAGSIADDAITPAAIQDGAITAAKVDQGVLDQVWASATRTLTSFGSLVSDVATAVWGATTRTLSAFGFAVETDSASREASKADVSGLATAVAVGAIPTNPLLTDDARLDNLDATIGSRLADADYTAPDNTGIAAAEAAALAAQSAAVDAETAAESVDGKLTTARAAKLDRDLAHADDADTYKADVSGVARDADMQTLLSRTAAGVTVTVGSHVADDGATLTLVQGEAYLDSINNAVSISVKDDRLEATIESDGTVPVLRIAPKQGAGATLAINGEVTNFADATATLRFELTAAQSRSLRPGDNLYEIDLQLAGNAEHVLTPVADAPCWVHKEIA